jgi:hypothetical protein
MPYIEAWSNGSTIRVSPKPRGKKTIEQPKRGNKYICGVEYKYCNESHHSFPTTISPHLLWTSLALCLTRMNLSFSNPTKTHHYLILSLAIVNTEYSMASPNVVHVNKENVAPVPSRFVLYRIFWIDKLFTHSRKQQLYFAWKQRGLHMPPHTSWFNQSEDPGPGLRPSSFEK